MTKTQPCPLCRGPTHATAVPIRVERGGHEILKILVPASACERCDHLAVDDEATEEAVAALERHTEPGDDIILPAGPTLH